jgi:PKD repeat protein
MKPKILFSKWVLAFLILASCSKKDTNSPSSTPPVADFSFSITKQFAPCTVKFTNNSKNALDYRWDFGDNSTSISSDPTNYYTKGGVYNVTLRASGAGGVNSITKTVNIPNAATRLQVTKITLGALTNTPTGNFDFYFKIVNSNSQEIWRSSTVKDFNSTKFPTAFTINSSIILTNISQDYFVEVWRVGLLSDTRLGFAVLAPRLYNSGDLAYPSSITIPSSINGTGLIYDVTWLP